MTGLLLSFDEGAGKDETTLGRKGAGLVRMHELGLPVPPGFIVSTEVCHRFFAEGRLPEEVTAAVAERMKSIERVLNREFGSVVSPLLVSVRSGAPVSMPGMMDTILDLGLSERTVDGLAEISGDERFAWDCYGRFVRTYGPTVEGIKGSVFNEALAKRDDDDPRARASAYLEVFETTTGKPFPQDPWVQLNEAIAAVFLSWNSPRAQRYRRYAGIDDGLGTAVVVQGMVFGNLPGASGTGVAFSRDPATGEPMLYGDFLAHAQGEDVVAGEHDVGQLEDCRALAPEAYDDLERAVVLLERSAGDMCEIEFTIENGRLWILQTRAGQRTGKAAVRIALDLVDENLIDIDTAIGRITPAAIARLRERELDPDAPREVLGRGVAASPGAAVGHVALTSARAEEFLARGLDVVLVRPHTSPDDVAGMIAARGIVTARGGRTSHAAVVARGMDKPAVCGVLGLSLGVQTASFDGVLIEEGDLVTIDGAEGEVYRNAVPLVDPPTNPRVERLLAHCDARRRVPLIVENGSTRASEKTGDHGSIVCTEVDDVEAALGSGNPVNLIIDVASSDDPRALVSSLERVDAGVALTLRVRDAWPASVGTLPRAPWRSIVADSDGLQAARLLAATLEVLR